MISHGFSLKRAALIALGTLLGAFFFYLAFRDVSWQELSRGMLRMEPLYLVPAAAIILVIQLLRAVRFGLILTPVRRLSLRDLWDVMNIWAALNMALPARLAELVRPYILRQRGMSFSTGVGAVIAERVFDLMGIVTLLGLVLWTTPEVPQAYSIVGKVMLVTLAVGYAAVLLILHRREPCQKLVDRLVSGLPERFSSFIGGAFRRLVDGLGIMGSAKLASMVFLCSLTLWTLFSALTYLFLKAFAVDAPFIAAITIQVLLCFGVALPSAPGFIGTFHAVGRYALALFGVPAAPAISFATVYHFFSLAACLILGAASYWRGSFSFERRMIEPPAAEDGDAAVPRRQ